MIEQGYIQDVRTHTAGSLLAVAANIGDTTLSVEDSSDFLEDGGSLQVATLDSDGVTEVTTPYAYVSVDPDLDVITLASPLILGGVPADRVSLWPLAEEKLATVLLTDTEEAVTARVTHSLRDLIPEGIRDDSNREFVSLELVNDTWLLSNVRGQSPSIQSPDYDESNAGWSMNESGVQLANANVLGTVGADAGTFNSITIGDQDLVNDILDPFPLGLIAHGIPTGVTDTAAVTSETMMFHFNVGQVYANRVYKVTFGGSTVAAGQVANDLHFARIKYTKDGTAPTTSSEVLDRSLVRIPIGSAPSLPVSFFNSFYYLPTVDYPTVIFGLTGGRNSGTGTFAIEATDPNLGFYMSVEDMGSVTSVGGTLSQISKATGTADATAVATYTKTWTITDGQTYDGDGTKRNSDLADNNLYQGRYSAAHGNTASVVCFDDANIRAALVGATIKSVKLTFRVKHAYYAAGLAVRIRDHNFSSPPTTYFGSSGTALVNRDNSKEGATYTVALPLSFGNALKNGTSRGVGFYSTYGTLAYFGYMYGLYTGSGPKLTITYTK